MAVNDDGSVDFDPAGWAAEAENRLTAALMGDPESPEYDRAMAEASVAAAVSTAQSLSAIASALQERG